MKITCIITDDEPVAREGIRSYVQKVGFLEVIGECEDVLQLNAMLKTDQPDLLFLDIEMPDMSGMDLLSVLTHPPKVIVISAYEQYALKGYELDVLDYLLKPVTFERFVKSVNKAYEVIMKEKSNEADEYIFIKSEQKIKKIFVKDIIYVAGMENYIAIYQAETKDIVYTTLKQFQESLPPRDFMQVHRSYIINLRFVSSIEGNELSLGSHKVPIARNLKEEVMARIVNSRLIIKK